MSKLDFKKVLEQEEARLATLHPTPEDIPGCISVFDDYLGCSGVDEPDIWKIDGKLTVDFEQLFATK